tara:strand:- start:1678 stop:2454 length:777 start_codon:yes stop_codon:yes gene_type:complete
MDNLFKNIVYMSGSNFIQSIENLYKSQSGVSYAWGIKTSPINDQYTFNIIFLFLVVLGILFFYIKINVTVDSKNWDVEKCNPKYLFYSGYLNNDTPLSNYDATLNNFIECTTNIAESGNSYTISKSLGKVASSFESEFMDISKVSSQNQQALASELEKNAQDISAQFDSLQNDISYNMDSSTTMTYSLLENVGLYVDQLNALMGYISAYMKKYLTYRMMQFANRCMTGTSECNSENSDYQNAIKIKNVLDSYYGGTSL